MIDETDDLPAERDGIDLYKEWLDHQETVAEREDAEFAEDVEAENSTAAKRIEELERQLSDAQQESIRWQVIAEGRGRTADDDEQAELAAWELLREARRDLAEAREQLAAEKHLVNACADEIASRNQEREKLRKQLAAERALADRLAGDLNDLWHHYDLTSKGYGVVEAALAAHAAARGKEQGQ